MFNFSEINEECGVFGGWCSQKNIAQYINK